VNWEEVLDDAIDDVLDDRGPADLELTLRRMVHRLGDGHGAVRGPVPKTASLPIRAARIEDTVVVLAAPKNSGVARGDELLAIDGVAIDTLLQRRRPLTSGSPQWIEHKLLAWGQVSEGPAGSSAEVRLRRGEDTKTVTMQRDGEPPPEFERPYLEKLRDGVFYVDLDRAPNKEIIARIDEIARAPGVVFDLRGYPVDEYGWLQHLLGEPDSALWMSVPHVIRPDFEDVTAWTRHGWGLAPKEPHIRGEVAFVTGPAAISYAESVMGIVEGYELGAIVGAPTAGANGNVNPFTVPGNFQITFTGMKVTRLDGRQHHLVGVQPTHPVSRTVAGVRAGRDEELEAALALVR
jgi:C-terminal processing protease CtpA/Prc